MMLTTRDNEMRAEGREEGRAEGISTGKIIGTVETMRDDDKSDSEIIDRIMRKFGLTQEEAEKYVLQLV